MTRPSSAVSSLQIVLVALLAGIGGSGLGEGLEGGTRSPQRVGAAGSPAQGAANGGSGAIER